MSGTITVERPIETESVTPPRPATDSSYGQILESSSIIGGAQVINLVIGLVRTKFVAVLIGPTGIGLLGIYLSINEMTAKIAGMGIQTSGVRDVAKFCGDGDENGVAKTITTLRRVCWFTGAVGMLLLCVLAPWISKFSFGSSDYSWAIAALGITILLSNVAGGQSAILQGTRRIGDLARIKVFGALASTLVAIACYAWLGITGIVPVLVIMSVIALGISTYFARRIDVANVTTSWLESWNQARSLVRLGLAMVFPGIVAAVVTYITRIWITRDFGLIGVGIFTAAFTLSALFVNFVLGAMGADYYPRLTAAIHDNSQMNRLINEQTEVGLLLAFPGLMCTLVLAPFALTLFYTSDFAPAAEMLKWFILGCMGQVLAWPLGFSLLAKGQGGLFVAFETAIHLIHLGMIWIGLNALGLEGVSVAFVSLNVVATIGMLLVTRQTIGFSWSANVWSQLAWMIPLTVVVFLFNVYLPEKYALTIPVGLVASLVSGVVCLRQLAVRVGKNHRVPQTIRSLPCGKWLLSGLP